MSVDKNHSEELKSYLNGEMSNEEAHAFEKRVVDDPFLQDAIDGAETIGGADFVRDVAVLNSSIENSMTVKRFPIWRMAAVISLLIVGGYSVWFLLGDAEEEPLVAHETMIKDSVELRTEVARVEVLVAEKEEEPEKEVAPVTTKIIEEKPTQVASSGAGITQPKVIEENPDLDVAGFEVTEADDLFADVTLAEEEEEARPPVIENLNVVSSVAAVAPEMMEEVVAGEDSEANFEKAKKANISRSNSFFRTRSERKKEEVAPQEETASSSGDINEDAAKNDLSVIKTSGTVTNEAGEGLLGVSVIVKGTDKSISTDQEGKYEIEATANDDLVFNSIGMITQEISIGARSTLDVEMESDNQELQEVVVTGHGAFNNQEKGYSEAAPVTGWTDFRAYLEEDLFYPEEAIGKGVEGRVVLQLTISRLGKITEIDVKKSLGEGCDEEAIRLLTEGPKWKAASQDGHSVETKLRVKVKFELEE